MAGLFSKGQNTVTEAERVSDFQVNQATYGKVCPIIFGTTRVAGNIIDYYNFTPIQHSETTRTGKGGGGSSQTNITYTYKAAILVGLCEGPIAAIGRVWQGADIITTLPALGFTLFAGALAQPAYSYTQSASPLRALPYSGLAYVAGYVDLNGSGGMYTYNFEVAGLLQSGGNGTDCNPADICSYVMTDPVNGIGIAGINASSLSSFRNFAAASDLLGSLPLTEQSKVYEIVNNLCEACDVMVFDSQGELKFVPRCEDAIAANGVTYVPDLTSQYGLDEDDFLPFDDGTLVRFDRALQSETYNQSTVEYINRANNYETEAVDMQVLADVSTRGLRPASTRAYHFFHSKSRAEQVAMRLALKSCYDRVTYTFRLSWAFCLLEPGDIVTISLSTGPFRLNAVPVRIETVEEDEDGELEVTAKPLMNGIASPPKYTVFDSERAVRDYGVDPGDSTAPMFFQIPATLTNNIQRVMLATSGGANWGGCQVWISDDGNTYRQAGEVNSKSRYGYLTMNAGGAADVELLGGELNSGTAADAQNARTLCYADGELFSYETATLTGPGRYTLSGLVRGQYKTTQINHTNRVSFARVDIDSMFGYEYLVSDLGKTLHVKLRAFNVFGYGVKDLSEETAYLYTIENLVPPDVKSLFVERLAGGSRRFSWTYDYPVPNDVVGFRVRVQQGTKPFWSTGQNVFDGMVAASPYETDAIFPGQYTTMVKAVDANGNESEVAAMVRFGIGDELIENIIYEHDIKGAGFLGDIENSSIVSGSLLADNTGGKFYGPATSAFYNMSVNRLYDTTYLPMTYEETIDIEPGQFVLQATTEGNARVLYAPVVIFGLSDESLFWQALAEDQFWGDVSEEFKPYRTKHLTEDGQAKVRVEIDGGYDQGKITRLKVVIDVPDQVENINDASILAAGTRLSLVKGYRSIKNVNLTIQDTGTGAQSAQIVDKDPDLGPLVKLYDASGTAVAGVIDATIQGVSN